MGKKILVAYFSASGVTAKPSFLLLLLAAAAWETQMKNLHRAVLALS